MAPEQEPKRESWERRLSKGYETFLRLAVQTTAAGLGLYIMWSAISASDDRPWLYFAAMAMMGLPAARGFGKVVEFMADLLDAFKEAKWREKHPDHREDDR